MDRAERVVSVIVQQVGVVKTAATFWLVALGITTIHSMTKTKKIV